VGAQPAGIDGVTAASRFDGGPLVQLGFGLCFVAFGGAIAVPLLASQLERVPRRPLGIVVGVVSVGAAAALWLPAYQGVYADTGALVVESGWSGLDPLSVMGILGMAAVTLVPRVSPHAVAAAAASQAGLLLGNLLIQAFTDRPTSLRFGLPVATGLSIAAVLVSLAGVRDPGG
jgi:hypothetical protein